MNGDRAYILGVGLDSSEPVELLNTIVDLATNGGQGKSPVVIFTPNPEFVIEAQKDLSFKELLNNADINLVDGFGLVLAGKILKQGIRGRISGADVVERLLKEGNERSWTIGLAGARGGVQKEIGQQIKNLQVKYPKITFINLDDPKFHPAKSGIKFQIVFACHGMKKQERWIWDNKDKIKANIFMGVGGSLDFLTGFTHRAPSTIRKVGLEWLWRGLQRPKHFKRVWKATAVFGGLVLKEKLRLVFGLNSQ